MFSSPQFKTWADAKSNVVFFCHITSRIPGAKHANLLSAKGGRGFPHMVVMNHEGMVLAKVGQRSTQGFDAALSEAGENQAKLTELSTKAAAGDKEAAKALFSKRVELGAFQTLAAAKEALGKLDISDEEKKALGSSLVGMEIKEQLGKVTRDPASQIAAGKAFAAMADAGRVPAKGTSQEFQGFWILQMTYAKSVKDVKVYERALNMMKSVFGNEPRAAGFMQAKEAELAALKAAAGE